MAPKIDFLYQFDKGFFGKTLLGTRSVEVAKNTAPKKIIPDSVSDFMKHFEDKMSKHLLERVPKTDSFAISEKSTEIFPNMLP